MFALSLPQSSVTLSDAEFEKITAVLLKSRTGEFDLESILFLKFRGLGKTIPIRLTDLCLMCCISCIDYVLVLQEYTISDVLGSAQAWRDWTFLEIT